MNKKNLALSFGAGLLGGLLAYNLTPQLVHAQSQPKEIRAESFVLVNEKGVVLGTLSTERGRPAIKLFDESRQEIWSVGGWLRKQVAPAGK